ncbi:hypothetical protein [Saccharopolyspora shandongensis]|uniref:hypothetical protein n=1 Tax=Saccharopolyspora shandongensis TaxID=418495 RepID=UPI0033C21CD9
MTDSPPPADDLGKRQPHASQEACTDHALRITGVITIAKATGCADVALMQRVVDALEDL